MDARREARNHMRDLRRRRKRKTSPDAVSQEEMDERSGAGAVPAAAAYFRRTGSNIL